jgi:hypothetical protein
MLHAHRIAFAHPRTGDPVEVEAPLEPRFQEMIEALDAALGRET